MEYFRKKPEIISKVAKAFLMKDETGGRTLIHPTLTHYLAKLFNNRSLLNKYFTINIDNLEEDFLPPEKVTHVYGTVGQRKELKVNNVKKVVGPQCVKCGKVDNLNRYLEIVR